MDDGWMRKRIEQVLDNAALSESQRWARRLVMSSAAAGVLLFGEFACTDTKTTPPSESADSATPSAVSPQPESESDPVMTIKYGVDWQGETGSDGKKVQGLNVKPLPSDLTASSQATSQPQVIIKAKPSKIDVGETNRYGVRIQKGSTSKPEPDPLVP